MRHFAAFEDDRSTTRSPGDGVSPQTLSAEPLAREVEVVPALQDNAVPEAVEPIIDDQDTPSRDGLPIFGAQEQPDTPTPATPDRDALPIFDDREHDGPLWL